MNRFVLSEPGDYERFLLIMHEAVSVIEEELEAGGIGVDLPDWPARRRRHALAADLVGLGRGCGSACGMKPPDFANPAMRLGAAYVLEGSRLGSQLLLKEVAGSASATVRSNTRFLSHGNVATMWPTFLQTLDDRLRKAEDLDDAVEGARAAFAVCQSALDHLVADRSLQAPNRLGGKAA